MKVSFVLLAALGVLSIGCQPDVTDNNSPTSSTADGITPAQTLQVASDLNFQCFGIQAFHNDPNLVVISLCDFNCCDPNGDPINYPQLQGGNVISMLLTNISADEDSDELAILPGDYNRIMPAEPRDESIGLARFVVT